MPVPGVLPFADRLIVASVTPLGLRIVLCESGVVLKLEPVNCNA
jgi:hypothetical protein